MPVWKHKQRAEHVENADLDVNDATTSDDSQSFSNEKHEVEHYEGSSFTDDGEYKFLGMRGRALNSAISVMAGMGFLLFGYDQGVMGSLLTLPTFYNQFPDMNTTTTTGHTKSHNSTWQGFVVAVYEIGCLAGAVFTIWFGDKVGRKKTIFIGCIIMIIGAIIQTASYSSGQLIAARIITGIGNGLNTSTVPTWQTECAKPKYRGPLVMMAGALITGGVMLSYWIDFGFYFIKNSSVSWRFPLAFQIVFPLVIVPFILRLPESPRWLLKKGRRQEAARCFSALDALPANDPSIIKEIEIIEASLKVELESTGVAKNSLRAMFTQGKEKNLHRAMLAIWMQLMQQITGINLITYYAGTIFQDYINMTPLNSRILAACNGTEYFIASWVALFTVERLGRRKLMLFGAAGQAITMGILTGTTWASANTDNKAAAIAAAVFLFIFNTCFAIGWLGMTWLVCAEITPLSIRAPANAFSVAVNWSFNFMVVMITPVAFDSIGPYTYTIFAAINALIVPVVYFLYPDATGCSLEEVSLIFEGTDSWKPWQVVKKANDIQHARKLARREEKERNAANPGGHMASVSL